MTKTISVIMPCFDAERHLGLVLAPLRDAVARAEVSEVIVVDDGSSDRSADLCREAGFRVIPSGAGSVPPRAGTWAQGRRAATSYCSSTPMS